MKHSTSSIVLVEPPLFDCRAPHLGCAMLAASLKARGYLPVIKDLNLQGILWLLEGTRLEAAMRRAAGRSEAILNRAEQACTAGAPFSPEDLFGVWRSLRSRRAGRGFPRLVEEAVEALRDPERFYQPATHRASRAIIDTALDVHAFACDEQLQVGLSQQQYTGRYRATKLADLLAATADRTGNLFLPFYEEVAIPEILELRPSLVGVSISNVYQVIPGLTLARLLHDAGVFIVVGGPFFSKFPMQLQALPDFFDLCRAVVLGEGEEALFGLVQTLASGRTNLSQVPNLVYREGGRVVATHRVVLNQVPDPGAAEFGSLPLTRYFSPEPVLPIYAGKGCGWSRCTFCEIPQINRDLGLLRRVRRPRRVAAEMQVQRQNHGVRHFLFTDECLEPWLLEGLAEAIEAMALEVNYLGYARFSEAFEVDFCRRLARSGCRKLLFGLESGCQKVNDYCHKGVDLERVPAVIEACQDAGIAVQVFAIVGLPGEGEKELAESAAYLSKLTKVLDLPASTLDLAPFYLNFNSWLGRFPDRVGLEYYTDQDFPLHAESYVYKDGRDSSRAARQADHLRRELSWEASALGFDLGYRNPLWPGWEEYSLLYLSHYSEVEEHRSLVWPSTEKELFDKTVATAPALSFLNLPFLLAQLASEPSRTGQTLLALSPAADLAEVTEPARLLLAKKDQHRVQDLVRELGRGAEAGEARLEALTQVVHLIQTGILQW